jgi:prephenate dehydrogenase
MKDEDFFKSRKIGIIGGLGAMGLWFEKYFKKKGFDVYISDLDTETTNKDIALKCDIIILSTPMEAALKVVEEIGEYISDEKLLMDICSLKSSIVKSMMENTSCEVIGCHPMFGQYTSGLNGQNIVLCPARGETYTKFFKKLFEQDGANVSFSDPDKHDKYMAVVQGVTHLITIATGDFLKKEEISAEEILNFATPVFRLNMALMGRLFNLDLSLYRDLVGKNEKTEAMVQSFIHSLSQSLEILIEKDDGKKMDFLKSIKDYIGDYTETALEETNKVFNFLYE